MDAGSAFVILLVHAVEPDEVLLSVGGHLRRRARDDEVSADTTPVTLAKLGQAEEEQAVFFFCPWNTLASL